MRTALLAFAFAIVITPACGRAASDDLTQMREAFQRPEYQGGHDGWGAARRRRLLAQFLRGRGIAFHFVTEPAGLRNAADKYRRVQIETVQSRADTTRIKYLTYVLDGTTPDGDGLKQQACDRAFFEGLAELDRGKEYVLHLLMQPTCKNGQ